jgi:hypothetical protein
MSRLDRLCSIAGLILFSVASISTGQSNGWMATNDQRIQYQWHVDKKIRDNWRCVIAFRWVGPPPTRAYNVNGTVTMQGDPYAGGRQTKGRLFMLFTVNKTDATEGKTQCSRVDAISIDSVQ